MPKRKKSKQLELEFLKWKTKKIEREMARKYSRKHKKRKHDHYRSRSSSPSSDGGRSSASSSGSRHTDTANDDRKSENFTSEQEMADEIQFSTETHEITNETTAEPASAGPDSEIIEILGDDPSVSVEYGADITAELASRLQHLATAGLTKESRKELIDKYLIPANCVKIGAPSMNPEIKAALTEVIIRRDNGIEARQKQLGCAISGLAALLNQELQSNDKNNSRSKQLMDVCRILSDSQHSESVIRRNFALFSVKKELKDHLANTKIDHYLFGENLADTLKSAKAVTKSGTELKTKPAHKPRPPALASNLNWKSPAPARKPPGAGRGRGAAPRRPAPGPAARPARSAPHASSYKPSSYRPYKQNRRR